MKIFSRGVLDPFSITCQYHDQDHVVCPMDVYSEERPCEFQRDATPTEHDESMTCSMQAQNARACVGWDHVFFGLCEEPMQYPDGTLKRLTRPLLDLDAPWVQKYIDDHPEKFRAYRPTNAHPNLRHRPELAREPTQVRAHIHPLDAFVDHQFAMQDHQNRRRSALAIWSEDQLREAEAAMPPAPHLEPAPVFETRNFFKPSLDSARIEIDSNGAHHASHTHILRAQDPPGHFVADRFDPDLTHIMRYQEHFASIPKLKPGAKAYTPDFTKLAHINLNHADNRAYHPSEYAALKERDAAVTAKRAEKLWSRLNTPEAMSTIAKHQQ
jgi:hypothetical protein